jgi:hypothetical protein
MYNYAIMREIEILMANEDIQFKLKTLTIWGLHKTEIHILDWLLLKSPNLIDLNFRIGGNEIEGRGL